MRFFRLKRGKPVRWIFVCLTLAAGIFFYPASSRMIRTFLAERALRGGHGETALRWLESIPQERRDGQSHLLLARTYRKLRKLDLIRDELQAAWDRNIPVELLEREQWLTLAVSGQMQEAEPHLRQLLQDPRDEGQDICECFVTGYFLNYQFAKAVPLLAAWEADFPDDPRPHELQGIWFQDVGRWSEAAEFYQKALQRNPAATEIRGKLAVCLRELHEYDKSKEEFLKCLKETPENRELQVEWSEWLLSNGEVPEARRVLEQVLKAAPENQEARFALATTLVMDGQAKDALETLRQLHRENPCDTEIQYSLASALQASGMTDDAAEMFRQVNEAREKLRKKQELTESLYKNPNQPDVRYEIAMISMNYVSPAEGMRWLLSVLDLDPRHTASHIALADYYHRIGKLELEEQHRKLAEASSRHVAE